MTRRLALFATGGLLAAAGFLTLGTVLSGSGWLSPSYLWRGGALCGPSGTQSQEVSLPFAAGDELAIDLPGTVHFRPGEPAEAIVSGDAALIDHIRLEAGRLVLDCAPASSAPRLDVRLSGPAITRWELLGNSDLTLSGVDQPELQVTIKGNGNSSASGRAQALVLTISGSGEARFKNLRATSAKVHISGSGDAQVSVDAEADITISGNGIVELSGQPEILRSEVKGNGRIVERP